MSCIWTAPRFIRLIYAYFPNIEHFDGRSLCAFCGNWQSFTNSSIKSTRLGSISSWFLHEKMLFWTLLFSRKSLTSSIYIKLNAVLYCKFPFFEQNWNLILQGGFPVKLFGILWKNVFFRFFFWRSPGLPGPKKFKSNRVPKKCNFSCFRLKSAFSERSGSVKNSIWLEHNKPLLFWGGRLNLSIWLHILAWYYLRSDCSPLSR